MDKELFNDLYYNNRLIEAINTNTLDRLTEVDVTAFSGKLVNVYNKAKKDGDAARLIEDFIRIVITAIENGRDTLKDGKVIYVGKQGNIESRDIEGFLVKVVRYCIATHSLNYTTLRSYLETIQRVMYKYRGTGTKSGHTVLDAMWQVDDIIAKAKSM